MAKYKYKVPEKMESVGLPYQLEHPGNVYYAIVTAGSQRVVIAHTENGKYFCGFHDASLAQQVADKAQRLACVESAYVFLGVR